MYNENHRVKWDKNLLKYEINRSEHKNAYMSYQHQKAVLNMNNKDFVEKYAKFSHEGKHYIYFSFVPNDNVLKEVPAKTDRALSIFGVNKIER